MLTKQEPDSRLPAQPNELTANLVVVVNAGSVEALAPSVSTARLLAPRETRNRSGATAPSYRGFHLNIITLCRTSGKREPVSHCSTDPKILRDE